MSRADKFLNSSARMNAQGPRSLSNLPMEPEYGVSNDDEGNVVLELGTVAPFTVSRETAIKLALLILKRAGVEVQPWLRTSFLRS